jgi:hypothetical protein
MRVTKENNGQHVFKITFIERGDNLHTRLVTLTELVDGTAIQKVDQGRGFNSEYLGLITNPDELRKKALLDNFKATSIDDLVAVVGPGGKLITSYTGVWGNPKNEE